MKVLYDNPFSPFARKVRLVLAYKGIAYERIDGLALDRLEEVHAVNPRGEVPVFVDDGIVVVNSADIVAHLEYRYPSPPVLPDDAASRVEARAWERLADTLFDAVLHDMSLWGWPTLHREDTPPEGLFDKALREVSSILSRMNTALDGRDHVAGPLSIADFALFPHVSSLRPLGIALDAHPNVAAWDRRMRELAVVREDLDYVKASVREKFVTGASPYEPETVVWRGDRLEWLFGNGYADWWHEEYRAGRAVVPRKVG